MDAGWPAPKGATPATCKLRQTTGRTNLGGKGCLPLDAASRVQGELPPAICKLRQTIACTDQGGKGCLPLDAGHLDGANYH